MIIGITDEHIGDVSLTNEQLEAFVVALNENLKKFDINVEAVPGYQGPWPSYEDAPLDGNPRFDAAWNEAMDAID